ncbi:MAG: hypothetical protein COA78_32205 [Blastopirellula sp.]|nr:MAG: hypothetical protein COA78_32205 [Blastopirellula sp.]
MLRKILIGLIVVQVLGYFGSIIAAFIKIETIVGTGPLFGLLGLILAFFCYYRRVTFGLYFGLSISSVVILCWATIVGFELTPGRAATPIPMLMIMFNIPIFFLAIFAVIEIIHSDLKKRAMGIQFSMIGIFGFTTLVAVITSIALAGNSLLSGLGIVVTYGALCGYVLWSYHRKEASVIPSSVETEAFY